MSTTTKVRIVVVDGLDWEWCLANREVTAPLFTFDCCAPLRTCDAPITPSAVCALLSGRDDGQGWFSDDRYATSQELIRTRPWFGETARAGFSVGLCNVPLTWPAFPVPGPGSWVVSGFPVDPVTLRDHRRPWRWPTTLDTAGYPIEDIVRDTGPGGSDDLAALLDAEDRIVGWMMHRAPRCDVEFVWLRSTDSAGHHAWGTPAYTETVRRACVNAAVLARDTNVESAIVISDHGFDAIDSDRCAAYHRTSHGPASKAAGLCGGHSEVGVLFARGERVFARGLLPEQRLVDVAGGIFDLLQLPPAPGMRVGTPAWSTPVAAGDQDTVRRRMAALGYVPEPEVK